MDRGEKALVLGSSSVVNERGPGTELKHWPPDTGTAQLLTTILASSELSEAVPGHRQGNSSLQQGTPERQCLLCSALHNNMHRIRLSLPNPSLLHHPSQLCTCRPSFQILSTQHTPLISPYRKSVWQAMPRPYYFRQLELAPCHQILLMCYRDITWGQGEMQDQVLYVCA